MLYKFSPFDVIFRKVYMITFVIKFLRQDAPFVLLLQPGLMDRCFPGRKHNILLRNRSKFVFTSNASISEKRKRFADSRGQDRKNFRGK